MSSINSVRNLQVLYFSKKNSDLQQEMSLISNLEKNLFEFINGNTSDFIFYFSND